MNTSTTNRPSVAIAGDPADRQAIEDLISDIETAVNTDDVDLAVEHLAGDAWATTVGGHRSSGWDRLLAAHRDAFAVPLRDQHARYHVGDVTFVAPDVAVVHKLAWATDAEGDDLSDEPAMTALYVMVERDGRWWIAARANTLVA